MFSDIKEVFRELKENTSKAEVFWTLILLIFLILCGYYVMELLLVIWFFGSLFGLVFIQESDEEEPILWVLLFPVSWALILTSMVRGLAKWTYRNVIGKFNNFLNNL